METKESIYEAYTKRICINCKNRGTNLCNITKRTDGTLCCVYYEKDKETEGYKDKKKMTVTAKRNKPIMKGIER